MRGQSSSGVVSATGFHHLTAPVLTEEGTRIPGLRFGDTRVHALLQALLIHRLLVHGFTNRDLRTLIAPLLGTRVEDITAGQMTYDLRRLRAHGLIERVARTRRYTVTATGLQHALLFTHAHDHLLPPGSLRSPTPAHHEHQSCATQLVPIKPLSPTSPTRHDSPPDRSRLQPHT